MGWEFVKFSGRVEMFQDMRLWTIRHFCLEAADSLVSESSTMELLTQARSFFARWSWIAPGVVAGVNIDEFVGDDPRRVSILKRVLERAAVRLREFGAQVPLSYLDDHIDGAEASYLRPPSSRGLVRDIARLRDLLSSRQV